MARLRTLGAVLTLALLVGPGCLVLDFFELFIPAGSTSSLQYREFRGRPELLWDEVKEVVAKHWELLTIDEDNLHLATEWDVILGAMYQTGFRRRALVWVIDADGGPYVEVRVEFERNMAMKNTILEEAAEWHPEGRDGKQEVRLLTELAMRLGRYGPSKYAGKKKEDRYLQPIDEAPTDPDSRLWEGMDR